MTELIQNHKVIVCVGSGGVGKTTVAATLGLVAAKEGKKVLVLTVDPAKRLATTLGLGEGVDQARVELPSLYSGELHASVIQSKKVFDDFVKRAASKDQRVEKILNNKLYQQLSTTLSGSQEFTALEKLYSSHESANFDLIILDTPPTKHAIDFLRAPQKISALFNEGIAKWFRETKGSQTGLLSQLFLGGTKKVFQLLEKLTGGEFIKELSDFFVQIESWQKQLEQRTNDVHRLLTSKECAFALVTSFDEAKLAEAEYFSKEIAKGGYTLKLVVINRAFPESLEMNLDADSSSPANKKMNEFYNQMKVFYSQKREKYQVFAIHLDPDIQVLQ
ncbi:MAG: ArsA family ATPase, partial [Pseudobdellovibrionaceae bacterium]